MGQAGQHRTGQKKFGKTKKVKSLKTGSAGKTSLKKNITPGQVLILLAGRFRGRRVVFLKQLESGLLLVTGPYCINGVPLRRVNQRYCINTSTKVDLKGADCGKVTDTYFARAADKKKDKSEGAFFDAKAAKSEMPEEKKQGQKKMDEPIAKGLSADMKSYLKARFSLTANMYPHELKF